VPAIIARDLRPRKWPHFMEKKYRKENTYHSEKVLGQLYDIVQLVKFVPEYDMPFDKRILGAYDLDSDMLRQAKELKEMYDGHIKRIMAQHDIETEFEVWSSFIMNHNQEKRDYSIAEELGTIMLALKDQFRKLSKDQVGDLRIPDALPRFVAAIYTVTAREVAAAVDECKQTKSVAGEEMPVREWDPKTMPLISFPWIFDRELGKIAARTTLSYESIPVRYNIQSQNKPQLRLFSDLFGEGNAIETGSDKNAPPGGEVFVVSDEKSVPASSNIGQEKSERMITVGTKGRETDIDHLRSGQKGVSESSNEVYDFYAGNRSELKSVGDKPLCNSISSIEEKSVGLSNASPLSNDEKTETLNQLRSPNKGNSPNLSSNCLLDEYGVQEIHIDLNDSGSTPLDLLRQLVGADDSDEE
jgi:hypothetical protein